MMGTEKVDITKVLKVTMGMEKVDITKVLKVMMVRKKVVITKVLKVMTARKKVVAKVMEMEPVDPAKAKTKTLERKALESMIE